MSSPAILAKRLYLCPCCSEPLQLDKPFEYFCSKHGYIGKGTRLMPPNCTECQETEYKRGSLCNIPGDLIKCNAVRHGSKEIGCGGLIPASILEDYTDLFRIAVAGMYGSGKTCFISRLKNQLRLAKSCLFSYREINIPENLPEEESKAKKTFIYPYYAEFAANTGRKKMLAIYDFPGEDFMCSEHESISNIFLKKTMAYCDGIFFVMDLNMFLSGEYEDEGWKKRELRSTFEEIWHYIYNTAGSNGYAPSLAFIFTKADSPDVYAKIKKITGEDLEEEASHIKQNWDIGSIKDQGKMLDAFVMSSVPALHIIFDEDGYFKHKRSFAVSSLGFGNKIEGKTIKKLGKPFHVVDPFLWMLGVCDAAR